MKLKQPSGFEMAVNGFIALLFVGNFALGDYLNNGAGDSGPFIFESLMMLGVFLLVAPIIFFFLMVFFSTAIHVLWNYSIASVFDVQRLTFKNALIIAVLLAMTETFYLMN